MVNKKKVRCLSALLLTATLCVSGFFGNVVYKAEETTETLAAEGIQELSDSQENTLECQISSEQTELTVGIQEPVKELACEFTVGIEGNEVEEGMPVPATLILTNKGDVLENIYVRVDIAIGGDFITLYPEDVSYTVVDNYMLIEKMEAGEVLTLNYEVTTGAGGICQDYCFGFCGNVYVKDEEIGDSFQVEPIYIIEKEQEEDNASDSDEDVGMLDIRIADIKTSKQDVVSTDDDVVQNVDIIITVTGADVDKLKDGDTLIPIVQRGNESGMARYSAFWYDAANHQFVGTIAVGGGNGPDGNYTLIRYSILADNNMNTPVAVGETDVVLFTYTNKTTDREAPVIEAVQIFLNGEVLTGDTVTLKKGDVLSVRVDVAEISKVSGLVQLIPKDWDEINAEQFMEMQFVGKNLIQMNPSQYDLEGKLVVDEGICEGTYNISSLAVIDKYYNTTYVMPSELTALYKEVKANPSNASLIETEISKNALAEISANIAEIVKTDALDEASKKKVEAAIANKETIQASLNVSTVPANSVNSKVKADMQKKADEVFGENTKVAYLDITLSLTGSKSGTLGDLTKLEKPITITVALPEEAKGDYSYKIIRNHTNADGTTEVTVLEAVKNADGTISFQTDRFSTYAIAYGANIAKIPSTGDGNMMGFYLALAVFGMAALAYGEKLRKANSEETHSGFELGHE